jgi:hypothetical protein
MLAGRLGIQNAYNRRSTWPHSVMVYAIKDNGARSHSESRVLNGGA